MSTEQDYTCECGGDLWTLGNTSLDVTVWVCPKCKTIHAGDDWAVADGLVDRINEFNDQFDYGAYHEDPEFWLAAWRHQYDEAMEAYREGDLHHAFREAADSVLVAFQFIDSCSPETSSGVVRERIENAEERGIEEEIVPKYIDWYEDRETAEMVNGLLGCVTCGGLLCVQVGEAVTNHVNTINEILPAGPADDIGRVLCASCGTVLWERGDDGRE